MHFWPELLFHIFLEYIWIYIYYICDMNYAFQCFSFIHLKYHHRKPVGGYVFDLVIWCRQMLISWWMATTFGHHILRPLPVETWRNNNRWWWKMPSLTGKRLGWLNICKCLDWLYEILILYIIDLLYILTNYDSIVVWYYYYTIIFVFASCECFNFRTMDVLLDASRESAEGNPPPQTIRRLYNIQHIQGVLDLAEGSIQWHLLLHIWFYMCRLLI